MAIWVVGCFETIFTKVNKSFVGLVMVLMLDSLFSKKWENAG